MKEFLVGLLVATSAHAAGPSLPDAGSILQRVQPPPARTFSPSSPGLMPDESSGKARQFSNETFLLSAIRITDNTLFDTATLSALVADAHGKSVTLAQLTELATRITDYYRSHGYPLARTIIPAQTIEAGVIRFQVIEPRYGKITLENQSKVRDPLLNATLAALKSGSFVEESGLDRTLLLLSDIPGIIVVPNLKSGSVNGTSDLVVSTRSGPSISGYLGLNNNGNKYTGGENLSGTVVINNPLRHGDTLTLSALTSGPGMRYKSIAYDTLLNGLGTHVGGSASWLQYNFKTGLGDAIKGSGTAQVTSLWAKQPLLRSRDTNVNAQLKYDRLILSDHIDAGSTKIYTDRHLDNMTASLSGNFHDNLMTRGITTWSLDTTLGRLVFDDPTAQTLNAETTNTQGGFSKLTGSLSHVRSLGGQRELMLGLKGQWASTNLDSSQKMQAGGPASVRAYAAGAVSGDAGYFVNMEMRQPLGFALWGQWTAMAFIDAARMTINRRTWTGGGLNKAALSGAGLGLMWAGPNQYTGMAYVAKPIATKSPLTGPLNPTQFSIDVQKRF